VKLKGLGPLKLGPVFEQFSYDSLKIEYYVQFAGSFVLIGWQYL
jgi:hypothetical protein